MKLFLWILLCLAIGIIPGLITYVIITHNKEEQTRLEKFEEEWEENKKINQAEQESKVYNEISLSKEETEKYLVMIEKWISDNHDDPAKIEFISKEFSRCSRYQNSKTLVMVKYRLTDSIGLRKLYLARVMCGRFEVQGGDIRNESGHWRRGEN